MCICYRALAPADVERFLSVSAEGQNWLSEILPRTAGPFIRLARRADSCERELVVGHWGLIPRHALDPRLMFPGNTARLEDLEANAGFKDAWKRGQRCIIPAVTFVEANWGTSAEESLQLYRADGEPWGLAGLWNTWVQRGTGKVYESYTMITVNADGYPLIRESHNLDARVLPNRQDKRSVIPLEAADFDQWLEGTVDQAKQLLKLAPVEVFDARPFGPAQAEQG